MKKALLIGFFTLMVAGLNAVVVTGTVDVRDGVWKETRRFIAMRADRISVSTLEYLDNYFLQDKVAIDFVRNNYLLPDDDLKDYLKNRIIRENRGGMWTAIVLVVILAVCIVFHVLT